MTCIGRSGGSANTAVLAGCWICSHLGMGREWGRKGRGWGWVPGVWSPGVRRLSGSGILFLWRKTGEKLAKEVEREVGTPGAELPDVLRLTRHKLSWVAQCVVSFPDYLRMGRTIGRRYTNSLELCTNWPRHRELDLYIVIMLVFRGGLIIYCMYIFSSSGYSAT